MGLLEEATKIAIKAVDVFLDATKKTETDVISPSLAVGYFYNFLDPVSRPIDDDDFELYKSVEDKDPTTFDAENIKLQIITPARLDAHAFDKCEAEFKQYLKGFIYLKKQKRFYGINYATIQLGSKNQLVIADYARPLTAVKRYYEEMLKRDTEGEKWHKTQAIEIVAFKETVRKLQMRGYGTLVNKLDFMERG